MKIICKRMCCHHLNTTPILARTWFDFQHTSTFMMDKIISRICLWILQLTLWLHCIVKRRAIHEEAWSSNLKPSHWLSDTLILSSHFDFSCDVEMSYVDMSGTLGTWLLPVHFQLYTILVILLFNCLIANSFNQGCFWNSSNFLSNK